MHQQIAEFPTLDSFSTQKIEQDLGHNVSRLVLRYDQNLLIGSRFGELWNGQLYYHQPLNDLTSIERPRLDWTVHYAYANRGIIPKSHNIWVQYMQSEENKLHNTFQWWIPSFPVLNFSRTPLNQILQFQEQVPAGHTMSTVSRRCKNTQQRVLRPQAQEYAVVIPTKYKNTHGWADCVDRFIQVVKETNKIDIVSIGARVGLGR